MPEDSRSLTAPGVVGEAGLREPLKGYERTDHADVRNPETHDVGLQRPCRVHPEMPAESVVSGNPAGVGGTFLDSGQRALTYDIVLAGSVGQFTFVGTGSFDWLNLSITGKRVITIGSILRWASASLDGANPRFVLSGRPLALTSSKCPQTSSNGRPCRQFPPMPPANTYFIRRIREPRHNAFIEPEL